MNDKAKPGNADHPLLPCGVCGAMADNSTPRREYVAELLAALKEVAEVEKQIRFMAYTSAGDPKRMDDMRMYAIWAGSLQKALAAGGVTNAG